MCFEIASATKEEHEKRRMDHFKINKQQKQRDVKESKARASPKAM
jgi:hypothetical protein